MDVNTIWKSLPLHQALCTIAQMSQAWVQDHRRLQSQHPDWPQWEAILFWLTALAMLEFHPYSSLLGDNHPLGPAPRCHDWAQSRLLQDPEQSAWDIQIWHNIFMRLLRPQDIDVQKTWNQPSAQGLYIAAHVIQWQSVNWLLAWSMMYCSGASPFISISWERMCITLYQQSKTDLVSLTQGEQLWCTCSQYDEAYGGSYGREGMRKLSNDD